MIYMQAIKKLICYIMKAMHYFVVLFITLGAFIPKKYLVYFLFAWPILYLHWQMNNNKCLLTQIECWLDNQPYCNVTDNDFPFVTNMLNYLHIEITGNEQKNRIMNSGLTCFWLFGMYRYYKKSLHKLF
jgi:hypothetical protein